MLYGNPWELPKPMANAAFAGVHALACFLIIESA